MSVEATKWALTNSPYSGTFKVIHIVIADIVNQKNQNECWVSERHLAQRAQCDVRTVRRAKSRMIADGLIEVIDASHGPRKNNRYRFLMPQTPSRTSGDNNRVNATSVVTQDILSPVIDVTQDILSYEQRTFHPPQNGILPSPTRDITPNSSLNPSNNVKFNPSINDKLNGNVDESDAKPFSEDSVPSANVPLQTKSRKPRPRDRVFETIAEVCKINYKQTTKSELGELRGSRRQLKELQATPEEVYRKAEIYHRMFPGMMLTPSALVKYWSRLEEENIPKTKAQLAQEDFDRACKSLSAGKSYETFRVETETRSDYHWGKAAPVPVAYATNASGDSAQVTMRDESSPAPSFANDAHSSADADSAASNGSHHGFPLIPSENLSNRSTAPLPAGSAYSSNQHGSLPPVKQHEPPVSAMEEETAEQRLANGASAKRLIAELSKQKSIATLLAHADPVPGPRYGDPQDPGTLIDGDPEADRKARDFVAKSWETVNVGRDGAGEW